ncbi:hypothetical protein Dxin01_00111 [Deinococcus xinjiangensis]|uniref:Uncharacterized protein n=1 Tax=Deinococcus xinjiangensis TaxID=457454 RepID=A0ABP9V892_9DEIO
MDHSRKIVALIDAVGPELLMDTPQAREGFMNGAIFAAVLMGTGLAKEPNEVLSIAAQAYGMQRIVREKRRELGVDAGWFSMNPAAHEEVVKLTRLTRDGFMAAQQMPEVIVAFQDIVAGVAQDKLRESGRLGFTLDELIGTEPTAASPAADPAPKPRGWWNGS